MGLTGQHLEGEVEARITATQQQGHHPCRVGDHVEGRVDRVLGLGDRTGFATELLAQTSASLRVSSAPIEKNTRASRSWCVSAYWTSRLKIILSSHHSAGLPMPYRRKVSGTVSNTYVANSPPSESPKNVESSGSTPCPSPQPRLQAVAEEGQELLGAAHQVQVVVWITGVDGRGEVPGA